MLIRTPLIPRRRRFQLLLSPLLCVGAVQARANDEGTISPPMSEAATASSEGPKTADATTPTTEAKSEQAPNSELPAAGQSTSSSPQLDVKPPKPVPLPNVNWPGTSAEQTTFGATASGGIYASTETFKLKVGTLIQARVSASSTPDPTRKVEFVPVLARLYLQGTVGAPWVKFYLQPEFAGQQSPTPEAPIPPAPRLLDVWVEAQPSPWFGVRLGVMRPAFSRSWINGLQRSLMFDRSDANLFFRTHGPIPEVSGSDVQPTLFWDRDIGATIQGNPFDGVLEYSLGVYNGNGPLFGRNGDPWIMPMGRLAVSPMGALEYDETRAVSDANAPWKFQVGVGAYHNRYRVEHVNPGFQSEGSESQRTVEADATIAGEGVYLSAEGYLRSRRLATGESNEELGATGLVGWMFWAPYLEVALRLSYVDPNREAENDLRHVYEAQLNYYQFGNNLKLGLRYSWGNNQAPVTAAGPGASVILPAGTSVNTVSLWTQLYF
jgi:hypothetical protein